MSTRFRLPGDTRLPALLLLLLAYGLLMSSALRKSATVDEQSHLFRGAAYLKEGATHFLLGHPLGASTLAALPLLTEPDLRLPLDTPAWEAGNWSLAGDAFLWQLNDNPLRILFLGRLPVIWLTLLLLALAYRWGRSLAGRGAGLAALLLLGFDPNLLAHGRIISGDVPVTFGMLLSIYGLWRWRDSGGRRHLLLSGVGLGVASLSKYNAALLLPMLGLLGLWLAWRRRGGGALAAVLGVGVVGGTVIWLVNGLAVTPLPGGPFWDDLFWVMDYFQRPHGAYLLGEFAPNGWWYYFPVAFALKTPLPTLLLLGGALLLLTRPTGRLPGDDALFLLLPALVYFAGSLTSAVNIGYRHLLPLIPFLWLFAATTLWRQRRQPALRWAPAAAGLWLLLQAVLIWPDYIPFFNRLAGGPEREWRLLSDSNVDWGQDLPALADWQAADGRPVKLSYFGTAHPSAYGVDFEPLPMWPPAPEQAPPGFQAHDPANPAPGLYALSVTSLHGIVLDNDPGVYAYFREREPLARIGKSIFVYEVAASGEPVPLVLAGVQPADFAPAVRDALASNDLRIRWLSGAGALLWPADGGWLAAGRDLDPLLQPWLDEGVIVTDGLYRPAAPPAPATPLDAPFGPLTLVDVTVLEIPPASGGTLTLTTQWAATAATDRPLQIFIHLVDEAGQIVTQWDGLDVVAGSWQPGDRFLQVHRLDVPPGGGVQLLVGVYDRETGERPGEPLTVPLR